MTTHRIFCSAAVILYASLILWCERCFRTQPEIVTHLCHLERTSVKYLFHRSLISTLQTRGSAWNCCRADCESR